MYSFCERVPLNVKELGKIETLKNIPNFKMWEANHQGALGSGILEVSVDINPVKCVGSQGIASSSDVVGRIGVTTPHSRALSGYIVRVGSSLF